MSRIVPGLALIIIITFTVLLLRALFTASIKLTASSGPIGLQLSMIAAQPRASDSATG